MTAKHSDRLGKWRSPGRSNRGEDRPGLSGTTRARLAAAALSVLSATLAGAKPTNVAKPVEGSHVTVAANPGNALVVRGPATPRDHKQRDSRDASAHGHAPQTGSGGGNTASDPLLRTAATTAFGFVKPAVTSNAGPAAPRIVTNGSSLAIVSTPGAAPVINGASKSPTPHAVSNTPGNLTLDNSLSSPGALVPDANGVYLIPPTDGKRVGGNLFYSFSTFDVGTGSTASFTPGAGNPPVQNIFARVTGSSSSTIDGAVQSTIPGADFYLINPHGIAFGANATLNVPGSFVVSTANSISLGSAGSFNATTPSASTLTADSPSAFGFIGSTPPSSITFTNSQLVVAAGKTLAVAGGPVQLDGATLYAPSGQITIASIDGAGKISIDPSTLDLTPSSPSLPLGAVSMTANSILAADGPTGGAIHVVAGSLSMDGSSISSATTDAGAGSPIKIALTGLLTLTNSVIAADTSGPGAAGNISISAGDVIVTGGSAAFTGIRSLSASPDAGGQAGSITLNAASLQLLQGAQIRSSTFGSGNSGNVTVRVAGAAVISGQDDSGQDAGIYTETNASGLGGNITFAANSLMLQDGGQISSSTADVGRAGNITANVSGATLISGEDIVGTPSGIYANSASMGQGGDAGNIMFFAGDLTLQAGGRISAVNSGVGNGGNITVGVSGNALISGESSAALDSGIFAESNASDANGNAGAINFSAASLTLKDGGRISASNYGLGNSGNVTVGVSGAIVISGSDSMQLDSGIYADSNGSGQGVGVGNIMVSAGSLTMLAGGKISASNFADGNGGNVTTSISGAVLISGEDPGQVGSGIYTEANGSGPGSGAGNIIFSAGIMTLQDGGTFSATTFGPGRAGNITANISGGALITGENSAQLPSGAYAESYGSGSGAGGGNIIFNAGSLTLQGGGALSSTMFGDARAGDIAVNVLGTALISGETTAHLPSGIYTPVYGSGPSAGAGNIMLSAAAFTLQGGGTISSTTRGTGNGGNVMVNVMGDALINGAPSGIFATSTAAMGGNAGNITFSAGALSLQAGGTISSFTSGSGNGGNVNVTIAGATVLDTQSAIAAQSQSGATGNGGDVTLTTNSLQILNGARVDSSAFGAGNGGNLTVNVTGDALITGSDSGISATANTSQTGNAGNITMTAGTLTMQSGGTISSSTAGLGNGGNVTVSVSGAALISGADATPLGSGIYSNTYATGPASGAGNINFSAASLTLQGGGTISSSTFGAGNGGNVAVNVTGATLITDAGSGIVASSNASQGGNAGSITLTGASLTMQAGGQISSATNGSGSGGSVQIAIGGPAVLDTRASITAQSRTGVTGNAGDLTLTANTLQILNGAHIDSGTFGAGNGGNVTVNVTGAALIDGAGSGISVSSNASQGGNAGTIALAAGSLTLQAGGTISSSTFGLGNGGNVTVNVTGDALITDADSSVSASSNALQGGNAGNITMTAGNLTLQAGGLISSSTFGTGSGGNVAVTVMDAAMIIDAPSGIFANSNTSQGGNAGSITMTADTLTLLGGGQISSSTFGVGRGGDVTVGVAGAALITGADALQHDSGIYANSLASGQSGDAGSIKFSAGGLTLQAAGRISSSTFGSGSGGTVRVNADNLAVSDGSQIVAATFGAGSGGTVTASVPDTGIITLNAGDSKLMTGIIADSSSMTPATGGIGGDVHVSGGTIRILHGAQISANSETAGTGGNVYVIAHGDILLQQFSTISVRATQADAGSIFVNTPAEIHLFSGSQITANAFRSGGNIYIGYNAPAINAAIATRTAGVRAGIPVGLILLNDGNIVARASTLNGGHIQINADALLQSTGSLIDAATPNRKAIQGVVLETNPSQDLSGQLAVLPNALLSLETPLQDICAQRLGGNFSSFIVTGQGGLPLEPGGWLPTVVFDSPTELSLKPQPKKK